jgi:Flp pilus assembly protein TadG
MRSAGLVSKFLRDTSAAALLEFTIVFPIAMLVILGTVDASLLMFRWAELTKATYAGARYAVVSNPAVISSVGALNDPTPGAGAGASCFNSDGSVNTTANCTVFNVTCTPNQSTGATCTSGNSISYTFQDAAFNAILAQMQTFSSQTIDRRQVQISYQSTGLGYVQRPVGSPMTVTISLRCMTYQFFFLAPLMGWVFPAPPVACNGIGTPTGVALPTFSTTLSSEDLTTN